MKTVAQIDKQAVAYILAQNPYFFPVQYFFPINFWKYWGYSEYPA